MVQQQKLRTGTSHPDQEKRRQIWGEQLRWEEGFRRREEKRHLEEELRRKEEELSKKEEELSKTKEELRKRNEELSRKKEEELRKRNEELTKKKEQEEQDRKDKERREDEERQRQYMERVEALRTAQQMQSIEAEDRSLKHLDALSGGTSTGSGGRSTRVAAKVPQTNLMNHLPQSPSGPTPEHSGDPTPKPQVRYTPGGGRRPRETSGCHCLIM